MSRLSVKHRRIDIHGHQTSLALEPEFWDWLSEIAAKSGATLKDIIEAIAVIRSPNRSLHSEIRVAVAAYFHGSPYPIYRCLGRMVPGRDGSLYLTTWPGGKRRNRKQTGKKGRDAFEKFLKSVRKE